jgi:predicted lipoprotein with Yx(FWY)xxD motif
MIGRTRRRIIAGGPVLMAAAILLSACSQAYSSPSPAASATAGGSAQIATQPIQGIGTVLVNGAGLTLYHLTTDTSTETTCTGGCAQVWPPLLAANGSPPQSAATPGTFGTVKRPDGGEQVTFNGMLLYTYAGDSQPGQANGQGIGGTWFAVTS